MAARVDPRWVVAVWLVQVIGAVTIGAVVFGSGLATTMVVLVCRPVLEAGPAFTVTPGRHRLLCQCRNHPSAVCCADITYRVQYMPCI